MSHTTRTTASALLLALSLAFAARPAHAETLDAQIARARALVAQRERDFDRARTTGLGMVGRLDTLTDPRSIVAPVRAAASDLASALQALGGLLLDQLQALMPSGDPTEVLSGLAALGKRASDLADEIPPEPSSSRSDRPSSSNDSRKDAGDPAPQTGNASDDPSDSSRPSRGDGSSSGYSGRSNAPAAGSSPGQSSGAASSSRSPGGYAAPGSSSSGAGAPSVPAPPVTDAPRPATPDATATPPVTAPPASGPAPPVVNVPAATTPNGLPPRPSLGPPGEDPSLARPLAVATASGASSAPDARPVPGSVIAPSPADPASMAPRSAPAGAGGVSVSVVRSDPSPSGAPGSFPGATGRPPTEAPGTPETPALPSGSRVDAKAAPAPPDAKGEGSAPGKEPTSAKRKVTGKVFVLPKAKPTSPRDPGAKDAKSEAVSALERLDAEILRQKTALTRGEDPLVQAPEAKGDADIWVVEAWSSKAPRRFRVSFEVRKEGDDLRKKNGAAACVQGVAQPIEKAKDGFELGQAKVVALASGLAPDRSPLTDEEPQPKPQAKPRSVAAPKTRTANGAREILDD